MPISSISSSPFDEDVEIVRCTNCGLAIAIFEAREGCPDVVRYEPWKVGRAEIMSPMRRIRTRPRHYYN